MEALLALTEPSVQCELVEAGPAGTFIHRLGDPHQVIAYGWGPQGIVAVVYLPEDDYDPDTDTSAWMAPLEARDPRRLVGSIPPELQPVLEQVLALSGLERLVTAAFWMTDDRASHHLRPIEARSNLLAPGFAPDASLAPLAYHLPFAVAPSLAWEWFPGALGSAASTLKQVVLCAPHLVTPEQQDRLLPGGLLSVQDFDGRWVTQPRVYDPERLQALVEAFTQLGIEWPTVSEHVARVNRANSGS